MAATGLQAGANENPTFGSFRSVLLEIANQQRRRGGPSALWPENIRRDRPPGRGGIADELAAAGFVDADEVGRGGAGVVYRCHQTSLGRSVAIKVLASDLDQDNRERFLREGYAMGKLSGHPNIVNILQVGVTETNRPYIVMPYHDSGFPRAAAAPGGRIAWPEHCASG